MKKINNLPRFKWTLGNTMHERSFSHLTRNHSKDAYHKENIWKLVYHKTLLHEKRYYDLLLFGLNKHIKKAWGYLTSKTQIIHHTPPLGRNQSKVKKNMLLGSQSSNHQPHQHHSYPNIQITNSQLGETQTYSFKHHFPPFLGRVMRKSNLLTYRTYNFLTILFTIS